MREAPKCPRCGSRDFREEQTVACSQWLEWDEKDQIFRYSDYTENYWDTIEADGYRCNDCDLELPLHFLKDWVE